MNNTADKLSELLENVSVIGAAGKMGSGISVLIAKLILEEKLKNPDKSYRLNLIDVNEKALEGLKSFIEKQMQKSAKKSSEKLKSYYQDLDEEQIIKAYSRDALSLISLESSLNAAAESKIIFEAVIENEELKIKILKELKSICTSEPLFFTNTSSIPISALDNAAGLDGKIIGYHFYNPPIVQKLVELITSEKTDSSLKELGLEFGKRLGKKLIPSNDVSGFIGNGHFLRDCLFALEQVEKLSAEFSFSEALYIVNEITGTYLVRPMGIFQLMDYVGIDVVQLILKVMSKHLKDNTLHSSIIDDFMERDIKGGQSSDGSQKDGFLKYEERNIAAVYDLQKKEYRALSDLKEKTKDFFEGSEARSPQWKNLLKDENRDKILREHFANLKQSGTPAAKLSVNYLDKIKEIAEILLADKVALSPEDVNEVMKNGFFWLYGPLSDLF